MVITILNNLNIDIAAQPSTPIADTAGEHVELTDSSISEIYEMEYANMKQKIAIWRKRKHKKLVKAAKEAKVCARIKATKELEESLEFALTESDKEELMAIHDDNDY